MTILSQLMTNTELEEAIKELLWSASDAIMKIYQQGHLVIDLKADHSPVTHADLAAHEIITKGLQLLTPDIPIMSEEDPTSLNLPEFHNVFWLIDPLDGTKEFIKRNDEFTCNVALVEDHRPTFGFVTIPAQGVLYSGGPGLGAFRGARGSVSDPIQCEPAQEITRIVASKSHLNEDTLAFIENIKTPTELIQAGSSLKFLKIAEGNADLYPRLAPTCEWDTAAAQAILEGAGGSVTQINGSPTRYGKDNILNPHFVARGF